MPIGDESPTTQDHMGPATHAIVPSARRTVHGILADSLAPTMELIAAEMVSNTIWHTVRPGGR